MAVACDRHAAPTTGMQHPPPLAVETSDAPVTGVTECTRPRCSCSSNGGLAATPSTLAHPGLEVERVRGVQFPGLGSVSLPLPDVGGSTAPLLRSARRSNSPASRRCQGTSAAMGYAGYVPAKLPPAKLTPVEAALQAVKSVECLEILGKLLYNCAVTPKEDKFRRIKLTNPRVAATIGAHAPAQEALAALGWVRDAAVPSELVVPDGLYFTMKEVRMVEAAKERLAKEARSSSSKNLAAMVSVQA